MTREKVLLRAAYDLLLKYETSDGVTLPMNTTAYYGGANRDGHILIEDIADCLGLDDDAGVLEKNDETTRSK